MGCSVSTIGFEVIPDRPLRGYLEEGDIHVVQESWKLLQDNLEKFGLIMFQRLITQKTHLKQLFTNLMTHNSAGKKVFSETLVKCHVKIIMQALETAVECLDNCEQLTALLIGIGERHAIHGVKPYMVPHLWPAISFALEKSLGEKYAPNVNVAWMHVFTYIASKLMEGISKWAFATI